jgi:hypothetical protein
MSDTEQERLESRYLERMRELRNRHPNSNDPDHDDDPCDDDE